MSGRSQRGQRRSYPQGDRGRHLGATVRSNNGAGYSGARSAGGCRHGERFLCLAGLESGSAAIYTGYSNRGLLAAHRAIYERPLATSPPNALLANVSYNGYGSGGYVAAGLTYEIEPGENGWKVLFFKTSAYLKVNGSYYWLAAFKLPILLSD